MLTDATIQQIEALQTKYPQTRGALLMALYAAQSEKAYLTKEDFAEVADLFNLDPAEVESVASFYTMYYTKPPGKCLFQLCTNISCMLENAYPVMEYLREALGIKPGEVTEDGLFGLMEVECLAACDAGPCLQLNDRELYRKVSTDDIDKIIAHFRNGGEHPAPGMEDNPLVWGGAVELIPLAPLTPAEIRQPAAIPAPGGAPPPKPAESKVKAPPSPSAAPGELTDKDLKAEAEAYARLEAAQKAREEAGRQRVEAEAARQERVKELGEEAVRKAEEAEKQRVEAIRKREEAARSAHEALVAERSRKLEIIKPADPEELAAEDARIAAAKAERMAEKFPKGNLNLQGETRRVFAPGDKIGEAAPALDTSSEATVGPTEAAPPIEAPAEPETPKVRESEFNFASSDDLPAWEPSNPYLRLLRGEDEPPTPEPPGTETPKEGE